MPTPSPKKEVLAADVMLAGDVLRVVHSGLPELKAQNAEEALFELRAEHEAFRTFLNTAPNGNAMINSCLLYPPSGDGTDGTLFLASQFAYAPLAGTALMAAATVLADEGKLARTGDKTASENSCNPENSCNTVILETARGLEQVDLVLENGLVASASWATQQPEMLAPGVELVLPDGQTVTPALVHSGLPYLVIAESELGLSPSSEQFSQAITELSAQACARYPVTEFGVQSDFERYLVMIIRNITPESIRVLWVSDKGEVANSAGGTGALAAQLVCERRGLTERGRSLTVEAPGGAFNCQISDRKATVTSKVEIVSRHLFYHSG
ncbi:proline racemase family protein [Kiloniella sp. b19]|uniref:proline racemase family protein n=1 Tax=Kiloniella sp. GXU_MW_B19 TaxID=3141326 RepID=UPI0031E14C29